MTPFSRSCLVAIAALSIATACVMVFYPAWLIEPIHQLVNKFSARSSPIGVPTVFGTNDLATGFLAKLDSHLTGYQIQGVPIGQRRAVWDQDSGDMVSMFQYSEQVPLEGPDYAPDSDFTVSGGFIQFLAALERVPPGRHASEAVRTARGNVERRLNDLDRARIGAAIGANAVTNQGLDLKSTTEETAKALKTYGKALGGYPASADIGATVLARFNPAEQMIITPTGGLPEEVLKVGTRPSLQAFLKRPPGGIAIDAKPLTVEIACSGDAPRSEVFNVHVGADAATILWFERGKWFNNQLLRDYRTGFWSEEAPPSPEAYFFGPTGRLRLIPVGILVVVRPFVIIDLPEKLQESLRANTCKLAQTFAGVGNWELAPEKLSATSEGQIVPSSGVRFQLADQRSPWILAVISERP